MKCTECGEEITACPSCGSPQGAADEATEDAGKDLALSPEEGARDEGGVTLAAGEEDGDMSTAKAPGAGWRDKVPWMIVLDAVVLLLAAAVVLVLVFTFIDWGGGGNPEGVVTDYFQALEDNQPGDLFDMLDPLYLEKVAKESGMSMEELRTSFVESSSATGTGGVSFDGLTYSTTIVEYATVEVTGGEEIDTDEEGQTSSMSMEGQEVVLVKRDGTWYLDVPSLFGQ